MESNSEIHTEAMSIILACRIDQSQKLLSSVLNVQVRASAYVRLVLTVAKVSQRMSKMSGYDSGNSTANSIGLTIRPDEVCAKSNWRTAFGLAEDCSV
jgi:hypothetical protein